MSSYHDGLITTVWGRGGRSSQHLNAKYFTSPPSLVTNNVMITSTLFSFSSQLRSFSLRNSFSVSNIIYRIGVRLKCHIYIYRTCYAVHTGNPLVTVRECSWTPRNHVIKNRIILLYAIRANYIVYPLKFNLYYIKKIHKKILLLFPNLLSFSYFLYLTHVPKI
jgi:hypothetical protein